MNKNTGILILGMHRSGTSAIAGALADYGVSFGSNLMLSGKDNPKGYFEHLDAYYINESILKKINCQWDFLTQLKPELNNTRIFQEDINNIQALIENEFSSKKFFALKDPRLSVLSPLWESELIKRSINLQYVLALRNPNEVVQSLMKRDNLSKEKAELLWISYMYNVAINLNQKKYTVIEYENLINNPIDSIADFLKRIGLDIIKSNDSSESGKSFVDKKLKHHNSLSKIQLSPLCLQLYKALQEKQIPSQLLEEIQEYWKLFYSSDTVQQFRNQQSVNTTLLYFDEESFKTKNNLSQIIDCNGSFDVCFDLSSQKSISKFQWLLSEEYLLRITQLKIQFRIKNSNIYQTLSDSRVSHNGKGKYGSSIEFENFSPCIQLNFENLKAFISEIRLSGQIFTVPPKTLVGKLHNEQDKFLTQLKSYKKKSEESAAQIQKLSNDVIKLTSENKDISLNNTKSEKQLRQSQDQLKQSQDQLKQSQDQLKRFQDELKQSQDQLKQSQDELKQSQDQLRQSQDQLDFKTLSFNKLKEGSYKAQKKLTKELEQTRIDFQEKIKFLQKTSKSLVDRYNHLSRLYLNIPNSAKWIKIQKLLFFIYRLFRKFKSTTIPEEFIFHPFIFNPDAYKKFNSSMEKYSIEQLKTHWYHSGLKKGLCASECFDVNYYLEQNEDLKSIFKNDYYAAVEHWLVAGIDENRKCFPSLDIKKYGNKNNLDIQNLGYYSVYDHWSQRDKREKLSQTLKTENHNSEDKINFLKDKYLERLKSNETLESKYEKQKVFLIKNFSGLKFSETPHISIVMPCWNRQLIICRAIDSVLAQTYDNYELIVVDDGSTDHTIETIKSKYKKELTLGKIKLIEKNRGGVSSARNEGLKATNGKYVAYLDSDNAWDPNFLKIMIGSMEASKAKNAYCGIIIYDTSKSSHRILLHEEFNRTQLESSNFIDLNSYVHHRSLYDEFGGFDVNLTRLVDWDLILKYTFQTEPLVVKTALVDYYLQDDVSHITRKENLYSNYHKIREKEYVGENLFKRGDFKSTPKDELKIAYVLWEFPVLSETFIMNELRWLVSNNFYVKVYYKNTPKVSAKLDFVIDSQHIHSEYELAECLKSDGINHIHSHFVYPTTTLLSYPTSLATGIPFTFTGHGVDIFHEKNIRRMNIREVSAHENCLGVFAIGSFHRLFYLQHGVPEEKIGFVPMSIEVSYFKKYSFVIKKLIYSVCCISRFVEKKGIKYLIQSAKLLPHVTFNIYGFGPEENEYLKLIETENLKNVILHGALESKEQVINTIISHDLFVMPCVKAKNLDMDGLPVVFMEAMSLGVPVISSNISSIGDIVIEDYSGFLINPKSPESIANAIDRFYNLGEEEQTQIRKNCIELVEQNYDIDATMLKLSSYWLGEPIDIFMVSYENLDELKEITRRIFKYTLRLFRLTIIDNNSSQPVRDYLKDLSIKAKNVNVQLLEENIYCGPASNRAIEGATSKYVIYLCSKEAFILDYNWEDILIKYMDSNTKVGIAGHIAYSPSYFKSEDLKAHPMFKNFRNKEFIDQQDTFTHVQGGIYILRKKMFDEIGGFNPLTPQDMTDVEYSYYIESCGWKLGSVDNVYSLTVKTRPTLNAFIDENTKIAHPLRLDLLGHCSKIKNKAIVNCNICDWSGETGVDIQSFKCPSCSSSNFDRSIFRILAETNSMYRKRKLRLLEINPSGYKNTEIRKAFEYHSISIDDEKTVDQYKNGGWDIIISNMNGSGDNFEFESLITGLNNDGLILSSFEPKGNISFKSIYHFSVVNKYLLKPIYLINKVSESQPTVVSTPGNRTV